MNAAANPTHRIDSDGILRIVFDMPGERVNLLNASVLTTLDGILDLAKQRADLAGVLLSSAKRGNFIAGMDVEAIAEVQDAHVGAEGARRGQAVFRKLEALPVPTVCAINGTCVGGGLEMALACDFRVCSDDGSVRVGLPEVRLGIIPGFGGTQRMPRLIGLTTSLDLILTGKLLDPRRALKAGLVDRSVPAAYLEREALRLLRDAIKYGVSRTQRRVRKPRPLFQRVLEAVPPLRRYALDQARKKTAEKARQEDYPAPFRAIEAIEAAFTRPADEGFELEARIEGELVPTATSKNLIWLFKSNNALKGDGAPVDAAPRRIDRVTVLGAGIMGGGIAQLVADNGLPVRLKDLNYDAILTALQTANKVWKRKLDRRRMTKTEYASKLAFIAPTLDDTGLVHTDLVIEAVVEDLGVKQKVLAATERHLSERAVFATNTSSIPISDIAAHALRPERVVGLHFFNPVHRMPLVEVIAGRHSSPEAVATAHSMAVRLGKTPVIVKDSPGFLVNRILAFYLDEAMRLLREGARIDRVDEAMTAFGMPMGPFNLMDQIGLDTARHVGQVLKDAFPDRVDDDGGVLEAMVGDERLGQKNDRGFYQYKNGKKGGVDAAVYRLVGAREARDIPPETLQERMVLAMINEAALCLAERVVGSPRDLDIAMIMGTGFPPFRGGLMRHADSVGIPIVVDRLSRMADAHGVRFRPCEMMRAMVREQRRFYGR